MKKREFWKSFFGAFIGVFVYKAFVNDIDLFDNTWSNFLLEIVLIGMSVLIGILVLDFAMRKFSRKES